MAKLSQVIGKKIRKEIPFYYQDNNGVQQEDKVIIYNPEDKQLVEIYKILKEKDEMTEEDLFYRLLNELTDLEIDMDKDKFVEFMSYYSDVFAAIKLELTDIVQEVNITGIEQIEKIIQMPEQKRIKYLALNPKAKEVFDAYMKIINNSKKEVNEEEIKKQKKKEELLKQKTELENKLKELE